MMRRLASGASRGRSPTSVYTYIVTGAVGKNRYIGTPPPPPPPPPPTRSTR